MYDEKAKFLNFGRQPTFAATCGAPLDGLDYHKHGGKRICSECRDKIGRTKKCLKCEKKFQITCKLLGLCWGCYTFNKGQRISSNNEIFY